MHYADIERHVLLVAPEIHWNTGNIGRTCIGAGAYLHLIRPLGFSLDQKEVRRAGLDYWHKVKLTVWDDFETLRRSLKIQKEEAVLFTKNGAHSLWHLPFRNRMFLFFGSETCGLPEEIQNTYGRESTYHIPISKKIRSLNLSTAVGIALYESLRSVDGLHEWS